MLAKRHCFVVLQGAKALECVEERIDRRAMSMKSLDREEHGMTISMPVNAGRNADGVTGEDYRDAMSRVAMAVHVVTTDGDAGRHGMTATAVTSVSDLPPTVLVCINRQTAVNDAVKQNGVFCVNALAASDEELANVFAGRGGADDMDARFTLGEWSSIKTGSPVLESGLVALDCRVTEITEASTHSIVFGEVVAIRIGGERQSLLYANRRFQSL